MTSSTSDSERPSSRRRGSEEEISPQPYKKPSSNGSKKPERRGSRMAEIRRYLEVLREKREEYDRQSKEITKYIGTLETLKDTSQNPIDQQLYRLWIYISKETNSRRGDDLAGLEFSLQLASQLAKDLASLKSVIVSLASKNDELLEKLEEIEDRSRDYSEAFKLIEVAREKQKEWMKENR